MLILVLVLTMMMRQAVDVSLVFAGLVFSLWSMFAGHNMCVSSAQNLERITLFINKLEGLGFRV